MKLSFNIIAAISIGGVLIYALATIPMHIHIRPASKHDLAWIAARMDEAMLQYTHVFDPSKMRVMIEYENNQPVAAIQLTPIPNIVKKMSGDIWYEIGIIAHEKEYHEHQLSRLIDQIPGHSLIHAFTEADKKHLATLGFEPLNPPRAGQIRDQFRLASTVFFRLKKKNGQHQLKLCKPGTLPKDTHTVIDRFHELPQGLELKTYTNGCFVAEAEYVWGKRVSGGIKVLIDATTSGQTHGYIKDLIVIPGMRGRGIGKKLIAHAINAMKQDNVEDVVITTKITRAARLYERLGFKLIASGSVANYIWELGMKLPRLKI